MENLKFWEKSKWDMGKHFELMSLEFDTEDTMVAKCDIAKKYNMRSFIVGPHWIEVVAREFKGTDIYIGSGAGYPMGRELPNVKALMVEEAIKRGATTVDMCMNYHALKAGRVDLVEEEMRLCREAARGVELKAIMEIPYLTEAETRKACELLIKYDFNWAKSATGHFLPPTMEQVAIVMDSLKGSSVHIKVSGVKAPHAQNAYAFLMAGVEIIGSQKCAEIIDGLALLQELNVFPSLSKA